MNKVMKYTILALLCMGTSTFGIALIVAEAQPAVRTEILITALVVGKIYAVCWWVLFYRQLARLKRG